MNQKENGTISFLEEIITSEKKFLPITLFSLREVKGKIFPKSTSSSFYNTDNFYCIPFYKPISKIFIHE